MWKTLPRYRTTNNIAYYKTGNGPAILLIHGVGLRLESWNAQINILSQEHTVYAIDLPGHGESDQLILESPNIDLYTQQIKLFA
ncbi:MAG: pimeloyl-ACP methyl ester carboxylesterase, partial [Woeseiaceae bacterium]